MRGAHSDAAASSRAADRARQQLANRYRRLKDFLDLALAPARRDDSLAVGLCVALIALGVLWRFRDLAYPPGFMFDEHHFVENARNYLHHVADWNDHPPLGKLLIIPGILFVGDSGVGWRIHEAVLGSVHVALVYAFAKALLADRRAGLIAAALVATDGIFVSYSRIALPDIPMNVFMLGALVFILEARGAASLVAAAVCLGCALSVKWLAIGVAPLVPILIWRRTRNARDVVVTTAWMAALAAAVYVAIWGVSCAVTHQPFSLAGVLSKNLELLKGHAAFTDWKNPADSRWYTWPFLWKPIVLHGADIPDGYRRVTSTVGNPITWFATTAAFAAATADVGGAAWAWLATRAPWTAATRTRALLLFAAASLLLQWMLTNRESYIWHYMGTYAMGIVLLAGYVMKLWDRDPLLAGLALLAVGAVSVFYAPVWTNGCLASDALRSRLFMPLWR